MISKIIEILKKYSNSTERKVLLLLVLAYGITSITCVGIPVWFQDPIFLCQEKSSPTPTLWFKCTQAEACNKEKFLYKIDTENSMRSLTYDFNLYCENIPQKLSSQTYILSLIPIALLINFVFRFSPRIRKNIIVFFLIFIGVFSIIPVFFFQKDLKWISISSSIIYFSMLFCLPHYYAFFNEFFNPELAKIVPMFCLTSLGIFSLVYLILDVIFKGNWKMLFLIFGIADIIYGICLFLIKEKKNGFLNEDEEENEEKEGIIYFNCDQISLMCKDKKILKNVIVLVFFMFAICYYSIGVYIDVSNLEGNFFINLTLLCIADTLGNFLSGVFVVNFNIFKSFKNLTLIPGIFLLLYVLVPYTNETKSNAFLIFLTATALVSKFVLVFMPFVLPASFISFFFTISLLICRIPITFLPIINYNIQNNFHCFSFAFYGFLFILSWTIIKIFTDVKEEDCALDEEAKQTLALDEMPMPSFLVSFHVINSVYSGKGEEFSKKISKFSRVTDKSKSQTFELEKL